MHPRPSPRLPEPSPLAAHFGLDPEVCFLNHGSFGAAPKEVLAAQRAMQDRMEREPVRFFVEDATRLTDEARAALAAFLHCDWRDLAPITNASHAVSTVMQNVPLAPGDEILITSHEYPACRHTMNHRARLAGARVVHAPIPFPCPSPDVVVDAVLAAVTPRTRLALLSHVTSPTGMVLPVERLVPSLEQKGVLTLIDGAHAPGMLPNLDLSALGAAFHTGNCHKWLCTPKGCAYLHVRKDLQKDFRPLTLSNFAESGRPGRSDFLTEFDYQGTADMTAFLTLPFALRFMNGLLPGGWPAIMRHNHDLVLEGRAILCGALGVQPPCPPEMIGSIATIVLPPTPAARLAKLRARPTLYHDALQDALLRNQGIQVPVWGLPGGSDRFIRISAQVYNSRAQYEYLAGALVHELSREAAEYPG